MSSSPERPETIVRFSRRMIAGLAVLIAAPWACLAIYALRVTAPIALASVSVPPAVVPPSTTASATITPAATINLQAASTISPDITESKIGPWGKLQFVPIVLELPEEYARVLDTITINDAWTFAGMNRDAALEFVTASGATAGQLSLIRAATWTELATSCTVRPPDDFVLSLTPEVRSLIYSKLMADPANEASINPSWFRVGRVDFRLRGSGLNDESVALLKRLLYPGPPGTLLFTDLKPALRAITDPNERLRFIKAITRKRTLVARLIINPDTDTSALAEYWGPGGRRENMLPLLDSMKYNAIAGIENPSKINIATLLPPFVQERLYRHAGATQPAGRLPDDCYWTTFNFFSDAPDDRVHDMTYLADLLKRDYVKIDHPGQLGDVILILDPNGNAVHAANYIADEIVLTKNGQSGLQPWILSPAEDVINTYRIKTPDLAVAYFRKR